MDEACESNSVVRDSVGLVLPTAAVRTSISQFMTLETIHP